MDGNKTSPEESRISSPLQSICFTGKCLSSDHTEVGVTETAESVTMTIVSLLGGKRVRAVLVGKPEDYTFDCDPI